MLAESELGPFGSGASPFIAVNLYGVAHIVYRGGDFGTYQIHHAYNLLPGDTAWQHENISTPNGNDFSAQLVVDDFNTLHLLASGNDGFGFPPHAYYFKKPDAGNWSSPELTTGNGAGWGTSLFIDNHGNAHILWEETSGNIYTGNIFYASNRTGAWVSDSLFCDGKSYGGNLVLDENGFGHALLFNGNTFDTEEILALHSPQPITDVKNDEENPPPQFSLLQNYPNPFNPTTTIRFTLPESRFTSLKIYDIFGKEVATLMNEILPAGNYERNWDATNFPSGMYFYRLTSGQFSQTRKLLLLK
ncbi:MAG: T9SS type A sorting domain-containing protein [Ignavibacteriales bacterium]|nr:T9SS type A sorting domain-containing protein [Ignavibacteriales bacterium]